MIVRRLAAPGTALAVLALLSTGCAAAPQTDQEGDADVVTCDYRPSGMAPARQVHSPTGADVPATGTATATIDLGDAQVEVTLDRAAAPCTVHSFESLAEQGYFDGTECHRLATSGIFILQCGDPTGSGRGGPGYAFDDELDRTTGYPAGTLAMANAGRNTNGSQFFLVYADTDLPPNYTVFGRMDAENNQVIADRAQAGHDGQYGDGTGRPIVPITIQSVTVSG